MNEVAIRVKNLGKQYRIGELEPYGTLRDAIAKATVSRFRRGKSRRSANPDGEVDPEEGSHIWALRNVSMEVRQGEAVGIIGPNGAGKTTLLKILSRITEPTEGIVELRGRVGSLLEVGTGFHQELTGRENIYLNGAILGMTKKEINRKFEEIVDFSGIPKFIDTPVKRYSDGMRVRLGFSVAAHLEPEVLLVDEVLAVGDAAFRRKCLGKMNDVMGEGRTIVFVSHDMGAIQNLCSTAYALDRGQVFASGDVHEVIGRYLESVSRVATVPLASRTDRRGTGRLRLTGFRVTGVTDSSDTVQCGGPATFEIVFESEQPLQQVDMSILFCDLFEACILFAGSDIKGSTFKEIPTRGSFLCRFEKFPLLPGTYHLTLDCSVKGVVADFIKDAVTIHVVEGDYYGSGKLPGKGWGGQMAAAHDWELMVDFTRATQDIETG